MIRPSRSLPLAVLILLTLAGVRPALAQLAQFTVNDDGTVTDTFTGLIWDRCSWGQSGFHCTTGAASTHTWPQALAVAVTANTQVYKGHSDWRLPNRNELESLVNIAASYPAIDMTAFPNTPSNRYWSSTPNTPIAGNAWYVRFNDGNTSAHHRNNDNHVRLVRRGQSFDSFDRLSLHYRSKATGNWSASGTWEQSNNGSTDWTVASAAPDSTAQTIVIQTGHTVTVDSDQTIDQTTVATGGTLAVNSGVTLTVVNGDGIDLAVDGTGTVDVNGTLDATGSAVTFTDAGSLNLGGAVTSLGTFTPGTGTVTYDAAGDQTILGGAYHHLATAGSGTKTLGGAATLTGNLTIGAGTILDVSGSSYRLNLAGNWTSNGSFTANAGAVIFDGSGDSTLSGTTGNTFYDLTLDKTGGTPATRLTLTGGAPVFVTNALTLTQGTLDLADWTQDLWLQKHLVIGAQGRWIKHNDASKRVRFFGACTIDDQSTGGPQNLGQVQLQDAPR